eukprot:TRINITY_DN297_c0_g1_i15.p1 TRINITY_DN297_c0_g1~~TRINITY_DN297_c0_g1_i15.p1  ORF type:complete len:217 (+),score=32.13 TRINITY_DN297_c0_g1_i15:353-1003(+)
MVWTIGFGVYLVMDWSVLDRFLGGGCCSRDFSNVCVLFCSGVQVQGKGTLDWTFSTTSRGTIRSNSTAATTTDAPLIRPTTTEIPLEELKRRDPILCYADVHLYEDELHDNGIVLLNVKARLMPTCVFALQRFWLRVDGVEMRVRDVRLFHRFGSAVVLREYVTRAVGFEQLAALGLPIMSAELTEPAMFVDKMPVVSRVLEEIVLPGTVCVAVSK